MSVFSPKTILAILPMVNLPKVSLAGIGCFLSANVPKNASKSPEFSIRV